MTHDPTCRSNLLDFTCDCKRSLPILTDAEILEWPEDSIVHRIGLEREGWDVPPEAA